MTTTVNTYEAKAHLSRLIAQVERTGKPVTICRNRRPVVDLVVHYRIVGQILKRLLGQVPTLFAAEQIVGEKRRLRQAFEQMKRRFDHLEQALTENSGHDPL